MKKVHRFDTQYIKRHIVQQEYSIHKKRELVAVDGRL